MVVETHKITCIKNGQEKDACIELSKNQYLVGITFSLENLQLKKAGENYFDTLVELRRELEKLNIKLLCKGCCRNVYPSAMILSMGEGRKAYTLTYGEQAKTETLVDIFTPCLMEEYATVKQQADFFKSG